MKHRAFLSHNQAIDSELAAALEKALQRFAKPTFKRKAISVFRDASDLSATPDLWGKLEQSLAETDYFVWMASPGSASSKWCRKETEFWRENRPMDNFLIVLTEGELVWDDEKGDYDYEKSTAIPDTLAGQFKNEPLFVDLREVRKSPDLDLKNVEFKQRVAMIAATLHGKSVSDMIGEEIRVHKRNMRIRNIAVTALVLLTIAAVTGGIIAEVQRREAVFKTKVALNTAHQAFAQLNRDADPALGYRLAEHAYLTAVKERLGPEVVAEARATLIRSFYSGPFAQQPADSVVPAEKNFRSEMEIEGQKLELEVGEKFIVAKNANGEVVHRFEIPEPGKVEFATFTGDGQYVLGIGNTYVCSYHLNGTFILKMELGSDVGFEVTDVHPTDRAFLVAQGNGVDVYDPADDNRPKRLELGGNDGTKHEDLVQDAQFSPDGSWIVSRSRDEEARIWSWNGSSGTLKKTIRLKGMKSVAPASAGKAILVGMKSAAPASAGEAIPMEASSGTNRLFLYDDAPLPYFAFANTGNISPENGIFFDWPYCGDGHSFKLEPIESDEGEPKIGAMTAADGAVIAEFDTLKEKPKFEKLGYQTGPTGILDEKGDALFTVSWDKTDKNDLDGLFFSSDGKYALAWIHMVGIRIYPIDPEVIIEIMNTDRRFGNVWELDANAKTRYLIEEKTAPADRPAEGK